MIHPRLIISIKKNNNKQKHASSKDKNQKKNYFLTAATIDGLLAATRNLSSN
jgi:hypothetical protein